MPSDLYSKTVNLDHVYPAFLAKHLELKAACAARGVRYFTTEMHRPYARSDDLYCAFLKGGPRAAPAGLSAHNYGCAADESLIISESPRRVLRWQKADFDVLGEEATRLGLHWGAGYGDRPHISWPGLDGRPQMLRVLQGIYAEGLVETGVELQALREVWEYLDSFQPPVKP